jgi:hypothetical protein
MRFQTDCITSSGNYLFNRQTAAGLPSNGFVANASIWYRVISTFFLKKIRTAHLTQTLSEKLSKK